MRDDHNSDYDGPVNGVSTRKTPYNLQAEQALLGALLIDNACLDKVSDLIQPRHFFEPLHSLIYETTAETIRQGRRATPITIKYHLESLPPIEDSTVHVTIPEYLGRLARSAATTIAARDYAQTIFDLAMRRQLILAGEDIIASAYGASATETPAIIAEEGAARLQELSRLTAPRTVGRPFKDIVGDTLAEIEAAYASGNELAGLSTGFRDLDAKLGGMQATDFIVIAGRPGIGKTSLAVNLGFNVAEKSKVPVGIFSMEMSDQQLTMRIISERADVSSDRMRRGKVAANEWPRIKDAAHAIENLPLHLDQTGALTISQLSARARRWHREHKLGLVIVDYIQLMAGSGNRSANRTNEITEITMGLKALAKEIGCPVVGLSQLSRGVEARDDKRPMLSDLRESGSIEQDSDVVMFVYRESYYLEQREPPPNTDANIEWKAKMNDAAGLAEVIIAKQRHGPTGMVKMSFNQELTRFSDLIEESRLPARTWGGTAHD